ncbi:carbamoyltransferase HypF [Spirulina subsalsa FACHB-351]|uniref:Carbamoyltransferase n=1 Tax=Spirulina subsalsa FACHB-351 TaxID=234711 RepID=A0ABT3L8P9_9CYAN|nr:carbamoyltransferase HypF [Spirulina subsalsa]MCW6037888.1 carbamoyltransferase HypF [Spirulina subsalsa FACHB-351]
MGQRMRLKLTIRGLVQGVGFRPFIYRLATELGLGGWVNNSAAGVFVEVEGTELQLKEFRRRLEGEKPGRSRIDELETLTLDPLGYADFTIRPSVTGEKTALVLPDLATCPDCLAEVFDPQNRRFHYPFTNCTHCGPRYTIIRGLPYDRPQTTMVGFPMCPDCEAEYHDPSDRRFHAQPNACPRCGPQLAFWTRQGEATAQGEAALQQAIIALQEGQILAVKGLGGFHLMADAQNAQAVAQLRQRKRRPDKPFAVMYPSLSAVKAHCWVSPLEAELLQSPEAPIVLLRKRPQQPLVEAVAPLNPNLGVMLPYTPLHHLLLQGVNRPLVATSGNLANEPICTDEGEAVQRLGGIADVFLVHNRPIVRAVDDSVVREMAGQGVILRRARGYAPLPIPTRFPGASEAKILGVGAHLKNTVAVCVRDQVFLSQHIGDLETPQAYGAFTEVIESFQRLYEFTPDRVICDLHPDYLSSQYARHQGLPWQGIQHHFAHIWAVLAEHNLWDQRLLGVAWDGTGYGLDGTIWGGEFLGFTPPHHLTRMAHLRSFPLPGGDRAIREPRRSALGLLYAIWGADLWQNPAYLPYLEPFSPSERSILATSLEKGLNCPLTSSMGRLFDGVASLTQLCQKASFEGQGAMQLEFILPEHPSPAAYPLPLSHAPTLQLDWHPLILALLQDLKLNIPLSEVSAKFHNSLIDSIGAIAQQIGVQSIVLSGGCFQNKYLLETGVTRLNEQGFQVYFPVVCPPNDGGIAFGQIVAARFSSIIND